MIDTETDTLQADVNTLTTAAAGRGVTRALLSAMRPHQWVKNLFVIAPLLFSGRLTDADSAINASVGFLAFCALSSSVYIFNDWWDAEADQAHPEKRHRPISSGELPIGLALTASGLLFGTGVVIASLVGRGFALIGLFYAALIVAYCIVIKRIMILDAMTIAGGFVLRVLAGAVAVGVAATHWLVACTFLLALFLAFSKRRQELLILEGETTSHREVLGLYSVSYLDRVITIVIGAAIVCYALYAVAPETTARFGTDKLVYGTVFVIYGMLRYLALLNDPANGGNPTKLLLTDAPLILTIAGWVVYNILVIYRPGLG